MATEAKSMDAEQAARDLFRTPEGRSDPYPLYRSLRAAAPVHWSDTARAWLLSGYDDCRAVLRDPRFEKRWEEALDQRSSRWRERPGLVWAGTTLLNLDGAVHTRLRRRVFRWFTPRSVEALRPRIESMVGELLDDFAEDDGGDFMERVAFPLPIRVIGELLGVPEADLPPFRDRVVALTALFEVGVTTEMLDAADAAVAECTDYFADLIADKRRAPRDDLLSRLVESDDEDRLDDEEINVLATLVFFAGFETTTNLIGNGVLALLDQPDQMTVLREQPDACVELADELLRHGGTVQLTSRFTVEDVEVGGTTIPGGEQVFPLLGAANRDPLRYDDPDDLDVRRTDVQPLSFGGGVHHCLGAALARLEIDAVFRSLAGRLDDFDLDGARPVHRDRLTLRGLPELVVRLDAQRRAPDVLGARPAGDDNDWRSAFRRREEAAEAPDPAQVAARTDVLEAVPLLRTLGRENLEALAETVYPMAFDPGDVICLEGADSPDAYVIAEGEASVSIGGRLVATVGADDIVGERGVIDDAPRSATVTATTHVLTLAIARDRFHEALERNPEGAARVAEHLVARYGARTS